MEDLGLRIEDQQVGIGVQVSRNEDLRHLGLKGLGFQDLRISGTMIKY